VEELLESDLPLLINEVADTGNPNDDCGGAGWVELLNAATSMEPAPFHGFMLVNMLVGGPEAGWRAPTKPSSNIVSTQCRYTMSLHMSSRYIFGSRPECPAELPPRGRLLLCQGAEGSAFLFDAEGSRFVEPSGA
jgi:hypothetical protein